MQSIDIEVKRLQDELYHMAGLIEDIDMNLKNEMGIVSWVRGIRKIAYHLEDLLAWESPLLGPRREEEVRRAKGLHHSIELFLPPPSTAILQPQIW